LIIEVNIPGEVQTCEDTDEDNAVSILTLIILYLYSCIILLLNLIFNQDFVMLVLNLQSSK